MWYTFFRDKLERDAALTGKWITFVREREDLSTEWNRAVSTILNSHHIWNCRLTGEVAESELTDLLPELHWEQLLHANLRETLMILEDNSSGNARSESTEWDPFTADVLFQLLTDNAFYRGQLALLNRQYGIDLPVDELLAPE